MKDDLAGGQLPSRLFGANAAWWQMMILAHNLNAIMKRLVLGESWENKRRKAVRYHVINLAGKVINHANQIRIRISGSGSLDLLVAARQKILALTHSPPDQRLKWRRKMWEIHEHIEVLVLLVCLVKARKTTKWPRVVFCGDGC